MTTRRWFTLAITLMTVGAGVISPADLAGRLRRTAVADLSAAAAQAPSVGAAGQSATVLPDGRWLLVGGGDGASASIWDPQQQVGNPTVGPLQVPRAWHSATLLADGTVLIVGGQQGSTLIESPELFDPGTGLFSVLPLAGAQRRAFHTATLLSDGRVVVAGGSDGGPAALETEIWDVQRQTATAMASGGVDRSGHTAMLMPDGRVLLTGGRTANGTSARQATLIDASAGTVRDVPVPNRERSAPVLTAAMPANGATDVPLDSHIALRFSDALVVASLTTDTLRLIGPDGPVLSRVIAPEDGRLAFIWPAAPLAEAATYTLAVSGPLDRDGVPVVPVSISFETASRAEPPPDISDSEAWTPDATSVARGWRSGRPPSPWQSLPPLVAPPGVTAIAGQVLTLDGRPLPDVTLEVEGHASARSDRTGRFLLSLNAPVQGRAILEIKGASASRPGRQYGFFEYGLTVAPGQTTVLSFTIWMPKLDLRHAVRIPSPTTQAVVVTTPYIPGLELHLPARTVLRGEDGQPVTEVTITPIPVDRPPFPLPKNTDIPVYFTVQPGGAYVYTYGPGPRGAQIVYPNYRDGEPGRRVQFMHYDPDDLGWYVYGLGTVTANAAQVVPDLRTRLYEFSGAMFNYGQSPAGSGPTPGGPTLGDPVDPATGVFSMQKTDLFLPDIIPIALTRSYNSGDSLARSFGRGMTNPYAMFLWSAQQYQQVDLVLPEGGKIHFVRTSAGTGYTDAVFVHQETESTIATPTAFYKARIVYNGDGWDLTLTNGTVYVFGELAPLQAIRDRFGNTLTITHANGQSGNVTQVTSPNGRFMAFTYDGSNRVTQVTDNIGRAVTYTYVNGNLSTVTDPGNNVTTYTWDGSNRVDTIEDGRGIVYLDNTYTNGRVTAQTLADPGDTYAFAYTVDGSGNITQTDITNPRGYVRRLTFNANHYVLTDTEALGTAVARTTTFERQTGSNLVAAVTDELDRRTAFTYDGSGYVLTATQLADTADAVTTTYTYEAQFHQLATVTDPLDHTWTLAYDAAGKLESKTDPLSHGTAMELSSTGQIVSITDALSHSWQLGYAGADLTSVTDPLSQVRTRFVDAAGRVLSTRDPLGRVSYMTPDALNRITSVVDERGEETTSTHDENSNLLSLIDALSHTTSYAYDDSDRLATRTDPLTNDDVYTYDGNDNVLEHTDRKGQVTSYEYDALDRPTLITFEDATTIAYTYDAGDRLLEIDDSANGTMTREYDGFDRLTEEATSQGTITYAYDDDGRRLTMTIDGQSTVNYEYDNAHRLTEITQGLATVTMTYDNANRRSTLAYPNGIVATYGYDNANQLTSLSYDLGQTNLGTLTYLYDAIGNRTSVGGTWARTGLPAALSGATYDASNRIAAWGGTAFSYDNNGNITNDGSKTYTWNVRDQLTGLSGGVTASFQYDGTGRRRGKTISGTTTNFLYDGLNFVQELTTGGTPTANLLTGLGIDETFTRAVSGGTSTMLTDALGSTLELADASGTLQTHYTYEPFGATTASGATSTNAQQYTGRENDGTGLYSHRARFYSPALQRFISEDPIEFEGGDVSLYAYVGNSPLNFVDLEGTFPILPILAGAAGGAGLDIALQLAGNGGDFSLIDWTEVGTSAAIGATGGQLSRWFKIGREFSIGRNLRIAPFGNRSGHPLGRWPHYHRRIPGPNGKPIPGGSKKWHRPWEPPSRGPGKPGGPGLPGSWPFSLPDGPEGGRKG